MADEDYEFVSHKKVEDLQRELDSIKGHGKSRDSATLSELKTKLDNFMKILEEAGKGMDDDPAQLQKTIEDLSSKIDTIIDQNEKIATGILALADMLREDMKGPMNGSTSGSTGGMTNAPMSEPPFTDSWKDQSKEPVIPMPPAPMQNSWNSVSTPMQQTSPMQTPQMNSMPLQPMQSLELPFPDDFDIKPINSMPPKKKSLFGFMKR